MNIRVQNEDLEKLILSKYACKSRESKGREKQEDKCLMRTDFQRDRDRIIHSKAFRRLKHKTQVYISPNGDHYRTRITHTLEVSQISRTIARAIRLNEDLVEAISLGHDLGHTPFGHIGEAALNKISKNGFKHNIQSLRVVDKLEIKKDKRGLNLCYETRDGIRNHSGEDLPQTLEGMLVRLCDRVAYINHDIDDSIRAGIISNEDLPKDITYVLGESHGERINTMVMDIIENSLDNNSIEMSEEVKDASDALRKFMFENVYLDEKVKQEADKAERIIKELYYYYLDNPEYIPENFRHYDEVDTEMIVCDYIAGMTDRYVMYKFQEVFVPKSWNII